MLTSVFGIKKSISQRFTKDGRRVPVTVVQVDPMTVTQLKSPSTDGYWAVQLGIGTRSPKHITKPIQGHTKGATEAAPRFLREANFAKIPDDEPNVKVGDKITADSVLAPGDLVTVSGVGKGKGFASGIKRYHFKGGPRTHGQSDRERAPGSIGSTTTPGRVYKGKRMAGHLGNVIVTVSHLTILAVDPSGQVFVRGVLPGPENALLAINKSGKTAKHFEGLLGNAENLDKETIAAQQEQLAKSLGAGEESGSKTAEAIKKAQTVQKTA